MKKTHIMYGFITAIVMVIVSTTLYLVGLAFKPGMQYITDIPFVIGILLNAVAFSKANDGYVTFGNVFGSGFKASAIITLVTIVWAFISLMIFPNMASKGMEMAREAMAKKNMTDEQIDQAMAFTQKYFKVFMIAGILFATMFYGAIFSLIGGAIAQKKGLRPGQMA